MSKIKLKPCPFCGGEAFCYVSGRIEPEMPDMFWVRCKNCDVVTKSYTTREKAIKKWNTRALGWIPVEFFGLPENNEHNSVFWITIACDSGHRRTVKARWNYYRECFEYQNGKKVLQDVVAYKQYCEPKPYSPDLLETRKELEEDSKGEKKNE